MIREKQGIINIYSSQNNTIMILTDVTGAETIARCSGGMVVKQQHKEGTPYSAMKIAEVIADKAREREIRNVVVKIRAQGGNKYMHTGKGVESAIVSLTRKGMRINSIENITPVPHDGCRKKKRYRTK